MRILFPSFLHNPSLFGWAAYELDEKLRLSTIDTCFGVFSAKKVQIQNHDHHSPTTKKLILFPSSEIICPYTFGLCKKLGEEYLVIGSLSDTGRFQKI
jgi:hypothetical protein